MLPRQLLLIEDDSARHMDRHQAGRTNFCGSPCLLERQPARIDQPDGPKSLKKTEESLRGRPWQVENLRSERPMACRPAGCALSIPPIAICRTSHKPPL